MRPLLDPLTKRELDVLQLIARGASNPKIAACTICGKMTSGLVKRVCAQCRQTQKREERLKHKRKGQNNGTTARIRLGQALGATWNRSRRFAYSNHPHLRADYTSGPTLEEALITFLGEALSRYEALRKWKANTMPIVTDWSDKHETPNL